MTVVQLRDRDCDDREFVALGRLLASQLAGSGVPLVVNDRAHLVDLIGADGLHIGQRDFSVPAARALIGSERYLGLSVQTLQHVERARSHRAHIDYLGVGPVWTQDTKPDAAPACGEEVLAAIVASSEWPCVAIGGIGPAQIPRVRAAGADGVAVVSAVCGRSDPEAAARELACAWGRVGVGE